MATFRIALSAALLLGTGGTGRAADAEPPGLAAVVAAAASADDRATVRVGPSTGDAEKDTVGLAGDAGSGCGLVPRFSREVAPHGPSTGDAEKDSLGFRISGHEDGCASGGGGAGR
jgi:hypothetical protein